MVQSPGHGFSCVNQVAPKQVVSLAYGENVVVVCFDADTPTIVSFQSKTCSIPLNSMKESIDASSTGPRNRSVARIQKIIRSGFHPWVPLVFYTTLLQGRILLLPLRKRPFSDILDESLCIGLSLSIPLPHMRFQLRFPLYTVDQVVDSGGP